MVSKRKDNKLPLLSICCILVHHPPPKSVKSARAPQSRCCHALPTGEPLKMATHLPLLQKAPQATKTTLSYSVTLRKKGQGGIEGN